MPRTVDSIVRCHQLATERTRKGQPSWEGRLTFMKTLTPLAKRLDEGDTTLTAQELLEGFQSAAAEVRSKVPQAKGDIVSMEHEDLEFFLGEIESWTVESIEGHPDILEAFNDALDRLYDWCDEHRWWIEQ